MSCLIICIFYLLENIINTITIQYSIFFGRGNKLIDCYSIRIMHITTLGGHRLG